ncbi:MAG: DUF1738 domain-containing protein [Bacteroidetes bacterium]|nr:MAG: DUF1738 domain-containing protein [Bacteroidota bacterium]
MNSFGITLQYFFFHQPAHVWLQISFTMKNSKQTYTKVNLYQEVTNRIIDLLENQELTWDKPWVNISSDGKRAYNGHSKRIYSGINQILLSLIQMNKSFPYSGWLTFNQIKKLGGQVISGQKSSEVFYFQLFFYDHQGKRYEWEQVKDMTEEEQKRLELKKRFFLRYFRVFNIAQTKGLDDSYYQLNETPVLTPIEKDDKAENLIYSTNAEIIHWPSNEAFYNSINDNICLPKREQFKGKVSYYETVLHELGHWTGHPSRLNRQLLNVFGSEDYAKEELVAELCCAFLCSELGFSKTITNNAAYIQNWVEVLKKDHKYIFKAVSNAEKAAEYILSLQE